MSDSAWGSRVKEIVKSINSKESDNFRNKNVRNDSRQTTKKNQVPNSESTSVSTSNTDAQNIASVKELMQKFESKNPISLIQVKRPSNEEKLIQEKNYGENRTLSTSNLYNQNKIGVPATRHDIQESNLCENVSQIYEKCDYFVQTKSRGELDEYKKAFVLSMTQEYEKMTRERKEEYQHSQEKELPYEYRYYASDIDLNRDARLEVYTETTKSSKDDGLETMTYDSFDSDFDADIEPTQKNKENKIGVPATRPGIQESNLCENVSQIYEKCDYFVQSKSRGELDEYKKAFVLSMTQEYEKMTKDNYNIDRDILSGRSSTKTWSWNNELKEQYQHSQEKELSYEYRYYASDIDLNRDARLEVYTGTTKSSKDGVLETITYDNFDSVFDADTEPSQKNEDMYSNITENSDNCQHGSDMINVFDSSDSEDGIYARVPLSKESTLKYSLVEVVETEKKYILDLEVIIFEYKSKLQEKQIHICDDILELLEHMYNLQIDFLVQLKSTENNVEMLLKTFLDSEPLFYLYPTYFKCNSDAQSELQKYNEELQVIQAQLKDKFMLCDYLCRPIQRIAQYNVILKHIYEKVQNEGGPVQDSKNALNLLQSVMKLGNTKVAIASITNCPLDGEEFGMFIMSESFVMTKPKKLNVMAFLFQDIIVFATKTEDNLNRFTYCDSVKTSYISYKVSDNDADKDLEITVYSTVKKKCICSYVLTARTANIRNNWRLSIKEILWKQYMAAKENITGKHLDKKTLNLLIPEEGHVE